MTAVGVSSGIFRDIFSTEPMRRIFADESRIQKYLDIEAALARAQARLGIIPQNACDEILRHCSIAEYDFAKLKAQTERIGYPVLPVVQQLVALCRDDPANPRSARSRRSRSGGNLGCACGPRQAPPRHSDGRPQQSPAGSAD